MAPGRRSDKWDERAIAALRQAAGPLSAHALADRIGGEASAVAVAQVYRVLKRLIARGDARQIWLGRRFVARHRGEPPSLALCGRSCGSVRLVPCNAADALRAAALARRFSVDEVIMEVAGLCSVCRTAGAEEAAP